MKLRAFLTTVLVLAAAIPQPCDAVWDKGFAFQNGGTVSATVVLKAWYGIPATHALRCHQ